MSRRIAALLLGLLSVAAGAQEAGPTLTRIAASGTVYLGHPEASLPFAYLLPGQTEPQGYTWDLCGQVVKALEDKLGKPLTVVPVLTTANTRLMTVKAGMADLDCGATSNTVAHQKQAAFSTTFFVAEVKILVKAETGARSLADLAGKRVVTVNGTTAERLVKQAALQRNIAIRPVMANSPTAAMALLAQGEAEAYVADATTLAGQRVQTAHPAHFVLLDDSLAAESYGLVLPMDDAPFKRLVDATLARLMQSGDMATLYARWFTRPIPPFDRALDLPLSELNQAAFRFPGDKPGN